MLDKSKSSKLNNVCDIFDLSNTVKEPTCFTSGNKPSLVDVILTCSSECIGKTLNFNCGLSDVHNIIAFQLKLDVPSKKPRWCTYRSFRNFDVVYFNMDLESNLSQLNFSEDNDVNDTYEALTNAILSVTNKHAPLKKKKNSYRNLSLT